MRVPPSRPSWIWWLAQQAAERCCQLGSEPEDLAIEVKRIDGALRVSIGDVNLGGRRRPFVMAAGSVPGRGDPRRLAADLHASICNEIQRLRRAVEVNYGGVAREGLQEAMN